MKNYGLSYTIANIIPYFVSFILSFSFDKKLFILTVPVILSAQLPLIHFHYLENLERITIEMKEMMLKHNLKN